VLLTFRWTRLVEINLCWTKSFRQNYVLLAAQLQLNDNFSLSTITLVLAIAETGWKFPLHFLDYLPLSDSLEITSDSATAQQKTDQKKSHPLTCLTKFTIAHAANFHSTISWIMSSYFTVNWFQSNSMCIDRNNLVRGTSHGQLTLDCTAAQPFIKPSSSSLLPGFG